ncbi:MAG: hypothetical protein WCY62_03605 [Clostridia bacterium]|jgi:nicotinamide riboside kinase
MVIGIIGESCTGKSTIADALKEKLDATVYTGKGYIRFAKNESDAKRAFASMLKENTGSDKIIVYLITERPELAFLPDDAVRVLITADIEVIKERFRLRMDGILPAPISAMLERKHGMFDNERYDIHLISSVRSCDENIQAVMKYLGK